MNKDFFDLENIEAYLGDKLSPEQVREYQHAISQDSKLAERVEEIKLLIAGIEYSEDQRISNKISQTIGSDTTKETNNIKQINKSSMESRTSSKATSWIAIAASVLFIAAAGYFLTQSGSTDSDEILNKYLKANPAMLADFIDNNDALGFSPTDTIALSDAELTSLYEKEEIRKTAMTGAYRLYHKGDYKGASDAFKSYASGYPMPEEANVIARLYQGKSCLYLGDYDCAKEKLMPLVTESEGELQEEAEFHYGLTLLSVDAYEEAKAVFKKISNNGEHSYNEDASGILSLI